MQRFTATVDRAGRFVIPQAIRSELRLKEGSEILVSFEQGEMKVTTRLEALRRAQELLRPYRPKDGSSIVEQFLEERREEARQEAEE